LTIVSSLKQLTDLSLKGASQYWYYVILINPLDITEAGNIILNNLDLFEMDSGETCRYILPGFAHAHHPLQAVLSRFSHRHTKPVPGHRSMRFDGQSFVRFYQELERESHTSWRYSGECEFLLFRINRDQTINPAKFASYNLDDIVRNRRSISEFIHATIDVGRTVSRHASAKRLLDEKFYDMIMPDPATTDPEVFEKGWSLLYDEGLRDNSYLFISYSSRDFKLVSRLRDRLLSDGISCWMAPYDIPPGSNYALVIEHAIKHAGTYVLLLSKPAVHSVWVGKELKRAITRFQKQHPEKLHIVWLHHPFDLKDTPFAMPLEDIQIHGCIKGKPDNYHKMIPRGFVKQPSS